LRATVRLPTPRSRLRSGYLDVLVWCKACQHQSEADLQKLVAEGDVPLVHLPFRCKFGSRRTGIICTTRPAAGRRGTTTAQCSGQKAAARADERRQLRRS
jgi:hypothetical protein